MPTDNPKSAIQIPKLLYLVVTKSSMMKRLLPLLLICTCITASAQFKADNVKYTTVFPEDLCNALRSNPNYVLLDVRSQAEYDDTMSASPSLNVGHLKNSMHIDIRQLPQRWKELTAYKDRPLFVYCSHSQRSRRASRLLADSGFTKIYNINGGLTNFYDQGIQSNPCAGYEIVSAFPYTIVSPRQLATEKKSYYIIDLRNDSLFNGLSLNEGPKSQGRFEDAVSYPFAKFSSASAFTFPSKPILLVDESGNESPQAAAILLQKGFKNVNVLFDGMQGWSDYYVNAAVKPSIKWKNYLDVGLISGDAFHQMVTSKKEFAVIDVRSKDEFSNKSKNYWQNIGNVQNAVNIPLADMPTSTTLPASKDRPVIVYGFNGDEDVFKAAYWLKAHGYTNVHILEGGIWNLRWTSHNIKGKQYLSGLVVNVPPENE